MDRAQSHEELEQLIVLLFKDKPALNLPEFHTLTIEKSSDMFLCVRGMKDL
jgi:hypothetical protein